MFWCCVVRPNGLTKPQLVMFELERALVDGDCWIVARNQPSGRYPIVWFEGRSYTLHRMVLEVFLERPLLRGEQCNHCCDNPQCINPFHLYVGNQKQNIADAIASGAFRLGSRKPQAVLNENDVREIRRSLRGVSTRSSKSKLLAEKYGVTYGTIRDIVNFRRWKHLT